MNTMQIFWVVMIAAFLIIEAATPQLVTIWFAAGSLFGLIAAFLEVAVWLQFLIFVISSTILLILTRPLVKRVIIKKQVPTNADRLLGKTALVTERIDNINFSGQVKANGQMWSAKSFDGSVIEADKTVEIVEITGVKLVVKPL